MQGISIKPTTGVGDQLQFSSLPENYFKATGEKLVDISRPWFFDYNPYVSRIDEKPEKVTELWNFSPQTWTWPNPRTERRPAVYTSNAEIWASLFGVPVVLNRPRLYRHEVLPFTSRQKILLHTDGWSHGQMPDHVINHVVRKYVSTGQLYLVGKSVPTILGLPIIETPTLWDLALEISQARMFVGMDSGPSWIAAAYPDVIVKKVRTKPASHVFAKWVPLEIANVHSHWDDRCHQVFNVTEDDIGFTSSYRKI